MENAAAEAVRISSKPSRTKKSNLVSTQPSKAKADGVEVELNSSEANDAEVENEDTKEIIKSSLDHFEKDSSYKKEKQSTLKNHYISKKIKN